ncbi:MAG: sel1 repeat family protein [Eubacterium sp.]|nr:sel1 repeat family protein [Eubacterium sp.]
MIQYRTIEEAIKALTQEHGFDVLEDTPHFIALLSDYAPNFLSEQRVIRALARSNGFIAISMSIKNQEDLSALLPAVCKSIAIAFQDAEQQRIALQMAKQTIALLDERYSIPVDSNDIYDIGMSYYRRFPKEQNIPVALLLLEEAWNAGNVDSLIYVANSYLKGKGVTQNVQLGIQYLEQASKSNAKAAVELAERLWKGDGIEKDIPRSVSLLKRVNDENALYMLGEIYREGIDYSNAFEYYMKAAERNHVYAQFAVAIAYATGQGIKRNMQEAKRWLKSAAVLGHGDARKKLEELGERWD